MTNHGDGVVTSRPGAAADRLRWWILLTVMAGTFMGRLDQTVVNLALPKIIGDFRITVTDAGWIGTAYILANAVFVPVWGKLGDTVGRKKVYLAGFSIFVVGSVLAGLSWDLGSMIVFRVIQAVASSADYPTAMAIITVSFREGKERGQALGIWSASFAAAAVAGPLVGGPLVDDFGWRSVFLVNLPVGLGFAAMALRFIPESVSEWKTRKFDWWGAITLGVALAALVLVLDKGSDWGWLSASSGAAYATALGFFGLFVAIELRHPEPVVDFKFFRNSVFVGTLVNNFVIFMGMFGSIFLIPIFAQTFLGYSATLTGYLMIPMALMMMVSAFLGGRVGYRFPSHLVIAGSTLGGTVGLLLLTGIDPRSGPLDIMIPLGIMAAGMGFGMPQRTNLIASTVPNSEIGVASAVLALVRNVAGAFGIAVSTTLLQSASESSALRIASHTVVHGASPALHPLVAGLVALKAQVDGYDAVFWMSSLFLLVGAVAAFFVRTREGGTEAAVIAE